MSTFVDKHGREVPDSLIFDDTASLVARIAELEADINAHLDGYATLARLRPANLKEMLSTVYEYAHCARHIDMEREKAEALARLRSEECIDLTARWAEAQHKCVELAGALEEMAAVLDNESDVEDCPGELGVRANPAMRYGQELDRIKRNSAAILAAHDAEVERETLERVVKRRPSGYYTCPDGEVTKVMVTLECWEDAIQKEFAPKGESDAKRD